jgi:hypothetical protein
LVAEINSVLDGWQLSGHDTTDVGFVDIDVWLVTLPR